MKHNSPGSIAGEGSAMFIVDDRPYGAVAKITDIHIFHSTRNSLVREQLEQFLAKHLPVNKMPDLLLSGENGDKRFHHFYAAAETVVGSEASIARFKHLSGEHPTAAAFAVWLGCEIFKHGEVPLACG